jgi:bifunctional non-homologous end joining protein LigD
VTLKSRNGIDVTNIFPQIAAELAQQPVQPLVLDGELVAFADGKPSFQALQTRAKHDTPQAIANAERTTPTVFYCFDILHAVGTNLRNAEYLDRRRYLAQCLLPTPHLQMIAAEADGLELYRVALAAGFEGSVAKHKASRYLPGKRSGDWLKIKPVKSDEFVIGGYSQGKGSREALGALLLGYWDKRALRYAGNVGSGFDAATLGLLQQQLEQRRIPDSPFAEKLTGVGKPRWVKPELVAVVKYQELTAEGKLRQPVFLHLREDKDADSIGVPHTSNAAISTLDEAEAVRAALADGATSLNFSGETLSLTQLDKMLWPAQGRRKALSKRDLLSYLALVSPYMLPLLANRPLTMVRLPDGLHGERFFQKHWEQTLPPFVETVEVYSSTSKRDRQLLLCNNLATLLWLGQLGTLEFHIWHSSTIAAPGASQPNAFTGSETHLKHSNLNYPDYLVFDLDPYIYSGKEAAGDEPEFNRQGFAKSKEVAFALKALLDAMQLQAFVKLSGKTGLHIFVPLERTLTFYEARVVTELIGKYLMKEMPQLITMEWSVAKRAGKIFFDHNMNVRGKTLNAAYSPRALAGATVSMPVSWQELTDASPQDFTMQSLAKRLSKRDDPWRDLLRCRQSVENALNG